MPADPAEPLPDAGFDVIRRGYDQGQVDTHLRRVDAEIAILAADRNAAVDQAAQLARELDDARARAERLRAQVRTLAAPPQSVQGMSERMRSMLRLAEDEVADMLGRAETHAAQRRQEAEQQAAQTVAAAQDEAAAFLGPARAEATELAERTVRERAQLAADRTTMERRMAADRAEVEQEIAALRASVENQLAQERADLEAGLVARRAEVERECADAMRRSGAERALVEEDFTVAMDQRRFEAMSALTAEQAATRSGIATLRMSHETAVAKEQARAEAQARRIVADAQRRVAELAALRGRIVEQLGGARTVLGRMLGSLEPLDDEGTARASSQANGSSRPAGSAPGPTDPVGEPATVQMAPAADPDPGTGRVEPVADTRTDLEPEGPAEPAAIPSPTPHQRSRPRATAGRR